MSTFDYRRELTPQERLATLGVGLGVGVAAGLLALYLSRVLAQRTPLRAAAPTREPR